MLASGDRIHSDRLDPPCSFTHIVAATSLHWLLIVVDALTCCCLQVVAGRRPDGSKRVNISAQAIPTLTEEHYNTVWDAVVVGSGVGGLTTATEMASKGAKVLVLEKYIIPGGSAGTLLPV